MSDPAKGSRGWVKYADLWRDVWRGCRGISATIFALGSICASSLGLGLGVLEADPVAWLNGAAAIVIAVATLIEKSASRGTLRALEDRVLVLETKAL